VFELPSVFSEDPNTKKKTTSVVKLKIKDKEVETKTPGGIKPPSSEKGKSWYMKSRICAFHNVDLGFDKSWLNQSETVTDEAGNHIEKPADEGPEVYRYISVGCFVETTTASKLIENGFELLDQNKEILDMYAFLIGNSITKKEKTDKFKEGFNLNVDDVLIID
jgi:hypothetical protein